MRMELQQKGSSVVKDIGLFLAALLLGAYISYRWLDTTNLSLWMPLQASMATAAQPSTSTTSPIPPSHEPYQSVPKCHSTNLKEMCLARDHRPTPMPPMGEEQASSPSCPEYFRWIHEDLRPWKETGITQEMVERANKTAHFRLVVVNGKAYVQQFKKAFHTRDVLTWWGVLQLLRWYPGRVPDLDLMFDCNDKPVIKATEYENSDGVVPPPLFRFSGSNDMLDIVFPDWSFWGWPEINIKPWEPLLEDLKNGNERMNWTARAPYAYWKGNFGTGHNRRDLLKCNKSDSQEWNARLYRQEWLKEVRSGFKQSDLGRQCTHRYKIYIEGFAWSVSDKYILACNSPALFVEARFYDFFSRGLMPMHHYWPINPNNMCRDIKFAVDWGNTHPQEAQEMGKAGSSFVREEMKMEYIYDYMLHLLTVYAKLMKYKPTIPENAFELCLDSMACSAKPKIEKSMLDSIVKEPANSSPCTLPSPFNPLSLQAFLQRNKNSIKQVQMWEKEAWDSQRNNH